MEHDTSLSARDARELSYSRQLGTCWACGYGMREQDMHAHHRKRRKDLGWCGCNVVGLHGDCHVLQPDSVHQRPEWARERGLIVASWDDTRQVPVLNPGGWPRAFLLRCDGTWVTA